MYLLNKQKAEQLIKSGSTLEDEKGNRYYLSNKTLFKNSKVHNELPESSFRALKPYSPNSMQSV